MTRGQGSAKKDKGADTFLKIHETWQFYVSNVYGWAVTHEDEAISVTFKCRAPGDWIGVCKRVSDDGNPEVCFGTAFDFVSCVLALNAAMSADRWRPDAPWKG